MRASILVSWLLVPFAILAQAPTDPSPEPPPDKPAFTTGTLGCRLVAKRTTYSIDRKGLSAAKYLEAIRTGTIEAPTVDLVLELKNQSKNDIRVRISGAAPKLTLKLEGKGTIVSRSGTRARKPLGYVNLKPGEIHEMAIPRLAGNSSSTVENQLFWTEPGEYTLSAQFYTYVIGDAGGANPGFGGKAKGGSRTTTVTTTPIKVNVTLR